jgi:hexosaminidase
MILFRSFFAIVILFLISACQNRHECQPVRQLESMSLIPFPEMIEGDTQSVFCAMDKVSLLTPVLTEDYQKLLVHLEEILSVKNELKLEHKVNGKTKLPNAVIELLINDSIEEGHRIRIQEEKISIHGHSSEDVFYGLQTFRQLLAQDTSGTHQICLAGGQIYDRANYLHRGSMLDISRHFFSVDEVKRYIDLLSHYKMNILHLHLSDDQGWRIEIKAWPKLTEIGGSKEVGGGKGGFYTQEDYKDIVKYASDRFITIIPEIDMPGHTNAALASYAELNCDLIRRDLYTGTRVGFSSLCTNSPVVDSFMNDVISELAEITPGPYIHIGGDESDATAMEDYIRFIDKVQEIIHANGKLMLGWDDITAAHLDATSVGQHWAKKENAIKGVQEQGIKIIMSPASRAYLDMKYDSTTNLGLNWAGYIELDHAYNWNLEEYIDGVGKKDILGIEAPLWSETVEDIEHVEFMAFPRLLAYAEIGWSPKENRDWESFRNRVAIHGKQLKQKGVNFYASPLVDWK